MVSLQQDRPREDEVGRSRQRVAARREVGEPASRLDLQEVRGSSEVRVLDHINAAEFEAASRQHEVHYGEKIDRSAWDSFVSTLNSKIIVSSTSSVVVSVERCGVCVSWRVVGEPQDFSMSFVPWGEIVGQPVVVELGREPEPGEIAAHLFYEITWHGSEEEGNERFMDVLDRLEEVTRSLDTE